MRRTSEQKTRLTSDTLGEMAPAAEDGAGGREGDLHCVVGRKA